ncbi:hypothetical protein NW754_014430 [Fusarium falciforme]|nr:hypothetical protein NW754_014430 [Fusarium falciforme]
MKTTGSWKSVKTLDMFWEMMAYRQECSSGRMTGFIWLVFGDEEEVQPPKSNESSQSTLPAPETPKKQRIAQITPNTTPRKLFPSKTDTEERSKPKKKKAKRKTLKGPVIARQPRIKTESRNYLLDKPTTTAYYSWTPEGRGERIVDENDYKRIVELLLHLDFATLNKAVGSTRRWVSEVGGRARWGVLVKGTREPVKIEAAGDKQVNNLSGLVKRKRTDSTTDDGPGKVNVLAAGLVKKKPKEDAGVNVLSAGLVRKKSKE